jgi:hypothetical protein
MAYSQLATVLKFEHAQAETLECKLEIIPLYPIVPTPLYTAASTTLWLEMIIMIGAELFASRTGLLMARGLNALGAAAIPVAIRLIVVAKREGICRQCMAYPDKL